MMAMIISSNDAMQQGASPRYTPFARKGAKDGEHVFVHTGDVGVEEGHELWHKGIEGERLDVVGCAVPLSGRKVEDDGEQGSVVVHGGGRTTSKKNFGRRVSVR
jgi:hypothetical protein